MAVVASDLDALAKAADPNVVGVGIIPPGVINVEWFVVTRGDGVAVRIDTANGQAPTQAAQDAILNADVSAPAVTAREAVRLRTFATAAFQAIQNDAIRDRAIVLVAIDEINILRDWITQFKSQVALASSLADLKTRVAALPNVPQRTATQAKTAVASKIDAGGAD